jgi:hypothetical protein
MRSHLGAVWRGLSRRRARRRATDSEGVQPRGGPECEIFTAHSANQSRLEAIKQRNDPRNLFRANVIISPASNDQQEMPRLRRPRHSHRNVTARPRKGSYGLLKL